MSEGYKSYKKMIDELVSISHSSVEASCIQKGSFPQVEMHQEINALLGKLSQEEREILSKLVTVCRSDAIFDVLSHFEWLRCCHDLQISVDGQGLVLDKGQGFSDDYIGRLNGWEWPE